MANRVKVILTEDREVHGRKRSAGWAYECDPQRAQALIDAGVARRSDGDDERPRARARRVRTSKKAATRKGD
jgi:hypothetical protein